MGELHDFLIPRVFSRFSCKMGACRHSCCEGWPVTVSMKNYFTLLGMDCPKDLRDRLDCALRLVEHPTEEEYARFTPNWLGDCPMRMEDGRCSIHAELGEDVLSDVCRLYPRGIRLPVASSDAEYECSASNSCEGVIELLVDEREPMTFEKKSLPITPPPYPGRPVLPRNVSAPGDLRFAVIRTMQDRAKSIPERLTAIGELLGVSLLDGEDDFTMGCRLLAIYGERSDSIREYADEALARYDDPGNYDADFRAFETRFPDWEIWFEQILVNHLFFTQFPYHGIPMDEEVCALRGIYAMLRVLTVGWCAAHPTADDFADSAAALFRLVEHSRFYENYHRTAEE